MNILTINFSENKAAEQFSQSLKETGFAILTHHPLTTDLIKNTYAGWQSFFSSESKYDYLYQKPSQEGYFPFKTENAKNSKLSDLKEFYHVYLNGRVPEALYDNSMQLYKELHQLASTLLNWIEKHLPENIAQQLSTSLSDMIKESSNTVLRIIHYPPLEENNEGAVRAAPHEDINLITLLPAATAPGLQVLDNQGQWHSVNCDPGNIVVNVGDMLTKCTQNYYRSTTHRVTNPEEENLSRYSMPFFLHARENVKLSNEYTAGKYLRERLLEIGIY